MKSQELSQTPQELCAHPGCTCPPAPNSKYCSDYCHRAGDVVELRCGCMHAGCR